MGVTSSSKSASRRTRLFNAARSVAAYDFAEGSARRLFDISGVNSEARFSPNGAWIAFTSWDTGTPEVYLRPFLLDGRAQRLTIGGARSPRWGADAGSLYYQTADGRIMVLEAAGGAPLGSTAPRLLFRAEGYSRAMLFDPGEVLRRDPRRPTLHPPSAGDRGSGGAGPDLAGETRSRVVGWGRLTGPGAGPGRTPSSRERTRDRIPRPRAVRARPPGTSDLLPSPESRGL